MSIWAEIKHALNSTIGTNKFKPLNTLLEDAINSQKGLAPSNDIYMTVVDLGNQEIVSYEKLQIFTANWPGSFVLSFDLRPSTSGKPVRYSVYKNGNVYKTIDTPYLSAGANTVESIVAVDAGDIIGLKVEPGLGTTITSGYLVNGIRVKANVVDLTAISTNFPEEPDQPSDLTFFDYNTSVGDIYSFEFEKGMTWAEFINSKYNSSKNWFKIDGDEVMCYIEIGDYWDSLAYCTNPDDGGDEYEFVYANEKIVSEQEYNDTGYFMG